MTDLGDIPSNIPAGIVMVSGYDEIASTVSTSSATFEDITGLTFDLTVPTGRTGTIRAIMNVESSASGANVTGAWAISINASDKQESLRTMNVAAEFGSVTAQGQATGLTAGAYTVKGRHRRVSGATNVDTAMAQLSAQLLLE